MLHIFLVVFVNFYIISLNLKYLYKIVVIFVLVLYNKKCSREKPTEDGSPTPLQTGGERCVGTYN